MAMGAAVVGAGVSAAIGARVVGAGVTMAMGAAVVGAGVSGAAVVGTGVTREMGAPVGCGVGAPVMTTMGEVVTIAGAGVSAMTGAMDGATQTRDAKRKKNETGVRDARDCHTHMHAPVVVWLAMSDPPVPPKSPGGLGEQGNPGLVW